jgi:hypothetical protein
MSRNGLGNVADLFLVLGPMLVEFSVLEQCLANDLVHSDPVAACAHHSFLTGRAAAERGAPLASDRESKFEEAIDVQPCRTRSARAPKR